MAASGCLVCSQRAGSGLLKLNAVTRDVCGHDLAPHFDSLSHRTRAVRLEELKHRLLSKPWCVWNYYMYM